MEQTNQENKINYQGHYYGKIIRSIFIVGGLVMLLSFPFFSSLINLPIYIPIITIILFVVIGGLINPLSKWIFIAGSIIPVLALTMFEYYAFNTYQNISNLNSMSVAFFWINQALALMFFFATYLSVKTLRAMMQGKMVDDTE
ncbi:MAG: hypothetical protein NT068_03280 [Candidatus Nomurabacteria bacterium]|nr:hypothetical protein [Candidatus Nomurabacteria bacterium]